MTTQELHQGEHIVVGVDGSSNSRAAIRWAIAHAGRGDTITLVHAWQNSPAMVDAHLITADDDSGARGLLDHERARAVSICGDREITIDAVPIHSDPRDGLTGLDCDLLVVGARGHAGVTGLLLGSVSTHLARHARHPLVIVPHEGPGPAEAVRMRP